jgi:hypothetical protein
LLDQVNGVSWVSAQNTKLTNAINSYYQFLTPDGNRPALGDTYRQSAVTIFLKANLVQGVSTWPEAKPRGRDVWLFDQALKRMPDNCFSTPARRVDSTDTSIC